MGTFHATQVTAFQWKGYEELPMDIRASPKSARCLDLEVTQLHKLSQVSLENKKPEPVIIEERLKKNGTNLFRRKSMSYTRKSLPASWVV